jgi:hypothetical protein
MGLACLAEKSYFGVAPVVFREGGGGGGGGRDVVLDDTLVAC